ncbi:hypothetical protein FJZ20_01195, partial [Candidatus Pacearchaeota archaeon]|nr:hypothetical protein [Candidatus Pacearchaeota archaeon]
MRKEISFLIVTAIIALGIVLIYYWGGQPTGFAVIDQYKDETNCTDAGYTWENITTEEGCDIFSYGVGFINSTGYTLTGEEGATNFTVTGAWNITNESFPVAIPEQEYIVDSETWIVTNLTATEYSYVNFTYTYDNQTCGSVTGGQCVGPDEEPAVTVSISEPSEGYES